MTDNTKRDSFDSKNHLHVTKFCRLWVQYSLTEDQKILRVKQYLEMLEIFDKGQS